MTQYSNPDLTQRDIIEQSVAAIEAMIATIDSAALAAEAERAEAIDYLTAQVVGQHISILNGSKLHLEQERTRLNNIIAVWNGEEPTNVTTPMLPTFNN